MIVKAHRTKNMPQDGTKFADLPRAYIGPVCPRTVHASFFLFFFASRQNQITWIPLNSKYSLTKYASWLQRYILKILRLHSVAGSLADVSAESRVHSVRRSSRENSYLPWPKLKSNDWPTRQSSTTPLLASLSSSQDWINKWGDLGCLVWTPSSILVPTRASDNHPCNPHPPGIS